MKACLPLGEGLQMNGGGRIAVKTRALAAAVAMATVFGYSPGDASAQQSSAQEGWITVVDPAQWTGEGTRAIRQAVGRTLFIRGMAYHPSGISSVRVNGHRAILTPSPASNVVDFTLYLPMVAGLDEASFVAAPNEGSPIFLSRSLDLFTPDDLQESAVELASQRMESGGDRWAVIVGISSYLDEAIPGLRFAHRDAEALQELLLSKVAGMDGYNPDNVILLTNEEATFRNIRTALRGFLTSATEQDQVMFYFAGHGVRDPARPEDYYFLTHDTELDNLAGTALPMSDLEQALQSLEYRDLILIADACHSGDMTTQVAFRDAFGYNDINDIFRERFQESRGGEVVFTAGEGRDLSQEGERWGGGHGVFTYHLLEGMRGAADTSGDGIVYLGELMEYVRDQVRRDTRNAQNPAIAGASFDRYLPMSLPARVEAEVVADIDGASDPDITPAVEGDPVQPDDEVAPDVVEVEADPAGVEQVQSAGTVVPFTPTGALGRGLIVPGLGQWHTGRPGMAALVMVGVGAGVALALRSEVTTETRTYSLPFGGSYEEEVPVRVFPSRTIGVAAIAAGAVGGALEAWLYARGRSRPAGSGLALEFGTGPRGGMSLGLRAEVGNRPPPVPPASSRR
jgi:hypothetical protein